jgi:RNA polymerase sigma-70 factor (ECF subfamily)
MNSPAAGRVRSLIARARNDDSAAFGDIVRHFEHRLYGLLLLILKDAATAEDVMQDAFTRAYEHLHRFDETREFYPWLATIASRLAQNQLAKARRIRTREGGAMPSEVIDGDGQDPQGESMAEQRSQRLWQAVASLPMGERTAVYLVYKQDLTIAEAARALGTATGTVKTWLHRARGKLRRHISSTGDGGEESI